VERIFLISFLIFKKRILTLLLHNCYACGFGPAYSFSTNPETLLNSLAMKKNDTKPFNIPMNVKVVLIVLALYGAIALVTYLVW
jgi:hypothetical protein